MKIAVVIGRSISDANAQARITPNIDAGGIRTVTPCSVGSATMRDPAGRPEYPSFGIADSLDAFNDIGPSATLYYRHRSTGADHMLSRRECLGMAGGAALAAMFPIEAAEQNARTRREYEQPMFDIPGQIKAPVKIESIELLKRGSNYFVRTRSSGGIVGIAPTKQVELFVPIFEKLVAPFFIGKDGRDIETLIDGV